MKPTFNNFKRPAGPSIQTQKKLRIDAYEDEIASLLEKNSHLGEKWVNIASLVLINSI